MGLLQSLFGLQRGPDVPGVNAQELQALIGEGGPLLLVDVRSDFEFEHDGHIEGAQLLPLQDLMHEADQLPQDRDIVFVCRSGNRSRVACQQLMAAGHTRVKNFEGGMIAWQIARLPIAKGP